ncbi:stage II sporulation protein D [Paenibacillus antarcticus]|uniref:Stage II sporulation protein D n=1 Tax=Paenibacillus antarcticus TaxID=253703 RepID=A0A168QFV5_9BACL|nr:stage II sporulation protein D [Paenibacillus antarcticus]
MKSSKRRVPTAIWATAVLLALALLLPVIVVLLRHQPISLPTPKQPVVVPSPSPPSVAEEEPQVSVYLSKLGQIETLSLEDYVIGVVAAEMPAQFESAALTAQAIAARTFIVQRLFTNDKSGVPIEGADVTDTVAHQAYISKEILEKEWKSNGKSVDLAKLQRAVQDSRNIIMTYKGKPITASFFSTSNGYTENSEDYWKTSIPYLRSVSSPWDQTIAPGYKKTLTISKKQFLSDLGLSNIAIPTMKSASSSLNSLIHILSTTEGHRIKELKIGGVIFSGREVREKLGLRSSQFSWVESGDDIVFTTYGYGHGVGMSQWGANGMAKEGYTASQILKHYYTGIDFQQVTKLLAKK